MQFVPLLQLQVHKPGLAGGGGVVALTHHLRYFFPWPWPDVVRAAWLLSNPTLRRPRAGRYEYGTVRCWAGFKEGRVILALEGDD